MQEAGAGGEGDEATSLAGSKSRSCPVGQHPFLTNVSLSEVVRQGGDDVRGDRTFGLFRWNGRKVTGLEIGWTREQQKNSSCLSESFLPGFNVYRPDSRSNACCM